jgi:myo-inositol 2-dehydrogenase / D-chiro-inositol 1-dehydrogenase
MNQKLMSDSPSTSAISRRYFLGTTAAAAILPRVALAQEASFVQRRIKIGLIGAGGRGAWIANLFKKHGGYDFHAVADYFPEVAQKVGASLGVDLSRCFSGLSGYRKVIESGVEAVILETPPYFFPKHATAAVAEGLHVYMAKPVAVDAPGCMAVEAAARGQELTIEQLLKENKKLTVDLTGLKA